MAENETIYAALSEILTDLTEEPTALAPGMKLDDIPGWDSLLLMSLIVVLEDMYQTEFPLDQMTAFETADDLVRLITARRRDI